jgi:hypothetical protein
MNTSSVIDLIYSKACGNFHFNLTCILWTVFLLINIHLGGEWSASHLSHFTPRERAPGTHWIEGFVGPRAGLDTVE